MSRKIQARRSLAVILRHLKRQGRKVVFTNGCYDILHVGHLTLLERAKRLGDVLVVAINSDRSVRALKGDTRPLVSKRDRARLLAGLSVVDYVTAFDEPTPHRLIAALKPNVLVKGADWSLTGVVGRELIKRSGGRVVRVPLVSGYSTSKLVERIQRLAARAEPGIRLTQTS